LGFKYEANSAAVLDQLQNLRAEELNDKVTDLMKHLLTLETLNSDEYCTEIGKD